MLNCICLIYWWNEIKIKMFITTRTYVFDFIYECLCVECKIYIYINNAINNIVYIDIYSYKLNNDLNLLPLGKII